MSKCELKNGWWVDEHQNSWIEGIGKEEAERRSSTLIGCVSCESCVSCMACYSCVSCESCVSCRSCESCESCYSCRSCESCESCYSCRSCESCESCVVCVSCRSLKTNPQRYVTPKVGSRNAQTTIYWTNKDDAQIVCGCFHGGIDAFLEKVKSTHGDTKHGLAYQKQIAIFRQLVRQDDDQH